MVHDFRSIAFTFCMFIGTDILLFYSTVNKIPNGFEDELVQSRAL